MELWHMIFFIALGFLMGMALLSLMMVAFNKNKEAERFNILPVDRWDDKK